MKSVLVIPGDGVGPEVVATTVQAINTLTDQIEFVSADAGLECFNNTGYALPISTLDGLTECDAILLGTIASSPDTKGYRDPEDEIIRRLSLTTNVRRIKGLTPALGNPEMNTLIFSNNENMNSILELDDMDGITKQIRMNYHTVRNVCEIARNHAVRYGRRKATCIHGGYMFRADNHFMQTFYDVMAGSGLDVTAEQINESVAKLVEGKTDYEIIITLESYSKILGDGLSASIGGTYLTASMDYSSDVAMFKPTHGPQLALVNGNRVNPIGSMMSGVMMLKYLGFHDESVRLEDAIISACKRGYMPKDLGGEYGTYDFAQQVVKYCENPN